MRTAMPVTPLGEQVRAMEEALARACAAERSGDLRTGRAAVGEFLAWLHSVDWRVAGCWAPEGVALGEHWCRRSPGTLALPALRFARNSAHHDWSRIVSSAAPGGKFVWAGPPEGGRERRGAGRYRHQLAGRPLLPTLRLVLLGCRWLVPLLEPRLPDGAAAPA